ncbi:unnamed protein product, partial [Heterotrigona itama]
MKILKRFLDFVSDVVFEFPGIQVRAQDEEGADGIDANAEELCQDRPGDEYFRLNVEGDCRDVVRLEKGTKSVKLESQMRQSERDRGDQVGDRTMSDRSGIRYRASDVRLEDKREELRPAGECTKSGLKQITCPSGLAFDLDKQTCDWKGKVTNCDKLE